jgi:hypothetical protein
MKYQFIFFWLINEEFVIIPSWTRNDGFTSVIALWGGGRYRKAWSTYRYIQIYPDTFGIYLGWIRIYPDISGVYPDISIDFRIHWIHPGTSGIYPDTSEINPDISGFIWIYPGFPGSGVPKFLNEQLRGLCTAGHHPMCCLIARLVVITYSYRVFSLYRLYVN